MALRLEVVPVDVLNLRHLCSHGFLSFPRTCCISH